MKAAIETRFAAGFAEVGGGSQRAETLGSTLDSYTANYPANVTSGNLLIVAGSCYDSNSAQTANPTISGSLNGAFTVLGVQFATYGRVFIGYKVASSSGAETITVNPTGDATGSWCSFAIDEFSGVRATPLDVDGGSSAGSSTTPSDGITTGVARALIIGVVGHIIAGSPTITPNDGTEFGENEANASYQAYNAIFQITGLAGAYTIDWTLGASGTWACYTASFAPA